MKNDEQFEKKLARWGRLLLHPGVRKYGRPGKDPRARRPAPLDGKSVRKGLRAIVRRFPEVMVKVTGGGRGMGAIKAHMLYISRRGELALEDEIGDPVKGKDAVDALLEEWRVAGSLIPTVSHRREAFHVMLSMPPETDAGTVLWAAREFANVEFDLHNYAMVLHEPEGDSRSKRPHVHLIVRAQGRDGRRLNPRKSDLARWRQAFADRLMERGVAACATRRQARGELQPPKTLIDHHVGGVARQSWALRPGEGARHTEDRVLVAWKKIATVLLNSVDIDDQILGRRAIQFVVGMQTVARRARQAPQLALFHLPEQAVEVSVSRGDRKAPDSDKRPERSRGR